MEQADTGRGCVVWFTGLSGAGKTTLALATRARLAAMGRRVEVLDGEAARIRLASDLGYSREDREEAIRRIAFVANLLARHDVIALVAALAPYRSLRAAVRRDAVRYFEVYVNAPLEVCEERDPKGLYRLARAREIQHFIGIDEEHEPPASPDLECRTAEESVDECVRRIVEGLTRFLASR